MNQVEDTRSRPFLPPLDATFWSLAALTVAAAVLRFVALGHQGFWFDEANTALLVKYSPGQMLGLIRHTESTPPFYYCVAWVWTRVFGDTEAGLRSLSAVAGVIAVPVAFAAACRLTRSRSSALTVAALIAFNPFLIWYSQEARAYELLVLLCAAALLAFAVARERPEPLCLTAWVLTAGLALATHYYAVVAVGPQAAWLLWEHRRRRAVQVGVGIVVLCGLALAPLAVAQNSTGHDSWIAHSPLGLRLAQIVPQFLIGTGAPAREALKFASFALVALALLLLARQDPPQRRGALMSGALAALGFLLSLCFVAAGSDALITRNIVPLLLPAAILLAGGLTCRRTRGSARAGLLATIALCAIGLTATIGVDTDYDLQRPNWHAVATALGRLPQAGESRVILIQHYRTLLPLALYLPGLRFLRAPRADDVGELDIVSMRSPQQPLCWWGAACNLIPSQMQSRYAVPGFRVAWRRRADQFTILRLIRDRPGVLTRRSVGRSLQTTTLGRDDLLIQRS